MLTDSEVEQVLFGVGCLRSGFDLAEASAAVAALRAARDVGDTEWPRSWDELDEVLPRRGRRLWLVPATASMRAACPSGAA